MKHNKGDVKMDIAMRFVFDHTYDSPQKFSYDRSWAVSPERVSQMPHGLLRSKMRRPFQHVFIDPISEPSVTRVSRLFAIDGCTAYDFSNVWSFSTSTKMGYVL